MLVAWSSLDVANVVVAALTPVLVVVLGLVVNRSVKRLEEAQWANRKVIERRLECYDDMSGDLNDLYCFFRRVGDFQRITPPMAVDKKRRLDKAFHLNKFLMTDDFATAYDEFIGVCFDTFRGTRVAAQLRASVETQRADRGAGWEDSWADNLVSDPAKVADVEDIESRYEALMRCFAADIGVHSASSA